MSPRCCLAIVSTLCHIFSTLLVYFCLVYSLIILEINSKYCVLFVIRNQDIPLVVHKSKFSVLFICIASFNFLHRKELLKVVIVIEDCTENNLSLRFWTRKQQDGSWP